MPLKRIKVWLIYQKNVIQILLSKLKLFFGKKVGKKDKPHSFLESMIMKDYLPIVPFFF
jgi:hypothetical protein